MVLRQASAQTLAAALTASLLLSPALAFGWNANGQRMIASKAVDTLPSELRPFFESNRSFVLQHVTDPLVLLAKNPAERRNHFIRLDHYGAFPFAALPRDYKAAVQKFGKRSLEANGLLPWQVGLVSQKLTEALRAHRWDEARLAAASLAYYVSQAHDPFQVTMNSDGKMSGQPLVDQRFASALVDRFGLVFYAHPAEAAYIHDPTAHAFEICLGAHSQLEGILLADLYARQGLGDYSDEYYDRFYNQAGSVLVREISEAATDVGSYWMTAWSNAGKPTLPPR